MQIRNAIFLLAVCVLFGCKPSAAPIPAVVEGDSMAPTVCGEHLLVSCVECQCDFATEHVNKDGFELCCPNCGNRNLKLADAKRVAPAVVQLYPFLKFPRRWDVVGFELPDDAKSETGLKRIVGLPGETVIIRDGDLYTNDRILRKSWEQQKEVRVPVFDSKFNAIAPFDNSNRFRFQNEMSGWKVRGSQLRFSSEGKETSWLEYVHWRNFRRNGERNEEFPIEDSYGFNQQAVRILNATRDIMLEMNVEFENDSTIVLQFRRGESEFRFEVSKTEKAFSVSWTGETGDANRKPLIFKSTLKEELPRGLIEFSSFDRSVMLRINGTAIFELREAELESGKAADQKVVSNASDVFRVGGGEGSFKIERFRLWRDIHYLSAPSGFETPAELKLTAGSDEYILLGDNSPRSLDSRTWKKPGIQRSRLIGRLVLPLGDD